MKLITNQPQIDQLNIPIESYTPLYEALADSEFIADSHQIFTEALFREDMSATETTALFCALLLFPREFADLNNLNIESINSWIRGYTASNQTSHAIYGYMAFNMLLPNQGITIDLNLLQSRYDQLKRPAAWPQRGIYTNMDTYYTLVLPKTIPPPFGSEFIVPIVSEITHAFNGGNMYLLNQAERIWNLVYLLTLQSPPILDAYKPFILDLIGNRLQNINGLGDPMSIWLVLLASALLEGYQIVPDAEKFRVLSKALPDEQAPQLPDPLIYS